MSRELPPTNGLVVLVFFATGYAVIFAQSQLTAFRTWTGVQPDLLPGLMVCAALSFRWEIALGAAAFLGLLHDSLSGTMLGTTFATLSLLALVGARFRESLYSEKVTAHWIFGLVASGAAPLLTLGLSRLSGAEPLVGYGSLWPWAVLTLVGGLCTPGWFMIFRRLDGALRYQEMADVNYRPNRQMRRGRY